MTRAAVNSGWFVQARRSRGLHLSHTAIYVLGVDVLTKMFNEGKTVVFKMNPVNAYLGPYIEQAWVDAIAKNYLTMVYGGAEEGAYLVQHEGIDEIHITGSDKTYNTIVWGPAGPEREERKARNDPVTLP